MKKKQSTPDPVLQIPAMLDKWTEAFNELSNQNASLKLLIQKRDEEIKKLKYENSELRMIRDQLQNDKTELQIIKS